MGFALGDIEGAYGRDGGRFLAPEMGGRTVAMGGGRLLPPDRRCGLSKRMRVAPDLQGRGMGRALLAALEAHARGAGAPVFALDPTARQDRAPRPNAAAG